MGGWLLGNGNQAVLEFGKLPDEKSALALTRLGKRVEAGLLDVGRPGPLLHELMGRLIAMLDIGESGEQALRFGKQVVGIDATGDRAFTRGMKDAESEHDGHLSGLSDLKPIDSAGHCL